MDAVPVDPNQDLAGRLVERPVERGRLDAARVVEDPDHLVLSSNLDAPVARTAVDDEHLDDAGVGLRLDRVEAGAEVRLLVEDRDRER